MSSSDSDHSGRGPEPAWQVVLALLDSLPERPQRMRVRVAGVLVELDWRPLPAPAVGGPAFSAPATPALGAPATPALAPAVAIQPETPASAAAAELHYVCAPTVGTFYHAAEPGGPPLAAEGSVVSAGQRVGIVEAMKLMMPVEADRRGRVMKVLVANGQTVEYGERLVALAPADPD